MNNVIKFPKGKLQTPPQSMEELLEKVSDARKGHVDHIMEEVIPNLFEFLHFEGFDLSTDECDSTRALFIEAFAALLYKASKLEHPLHESADDFLEMVMADDDESETSE